MKVDEKPYILVYTLGKEIRGTNKIAVDLIKQVYGDINVYAVVIPTTRFTLCDYADKVYYDLDPNEWLFLFQNAKFIFTDSYHGILFSLKFRKSFVAYYSEVLRKTRLVDIGKRYAIGNYIINDVKSLQENHILDQLPDYEKITAKINEYKRKSEDYLLQSISNIG